MRCNNCGSIIPPGVPQCPICSVYPDAAEAQDPYQSYSDYPKTNYQCGVPPSCRAHGYSDPDPDKGPKTYATPSFHTYRQQVLTGFAQPEQEAYKASSRGNSDHDISKALLDLPQLAIKAFLCPFDTMVDMIQRKDRLSGGVIVFLSLLLSFLTAIIMVEGVLSSMYSVMSEVTGLDIADNTASINQGISYMANKVSVSVGLLAVICQFIAIFMPAVVTMFYLCGMQQIRFSFLLLSNFIGITTLPSLASLLLAAAASVISPYLSMVMLAFGQILSYVLLCALAVPLANPEPRKMIMIKTALICASETITLLLIALFGGIMMRSILQTLTGLTNSLDSLL